MRRIAALMVGVVCCFVAIAADPPGLELPKKAHLKFEQARALALAEAERMQVPANRKEREPLVRFFDDERDVWWVFHFAPEHPGPGEWSDILVNDRTKEVRFMGGM